MVKVEGSSILYGRSKWCSYGLTDGKALVRRKIGGGTGVVSRGFTLWSSSNLKVRWVVGDEKEVVSWWFRALFWD